MSDRKAFLTAEWRYLAILNYAVERDVLEPLVPSGTALDTYQGKAYVSMVAFLFQQTRLKGVPVPFHQDFEEVNLRFYVRRFSGEEWRRGVVFIKEIVPKPAIAAVARWVYNENYVSLPMRHDWSRTTEGEPRSVEYGWELDSRWNQLRMTVAGPSFLPRAGSLEEFITEHYWGYARQKDGGCVEYQVEHPQWRVWKADQSSLACDAAALYGESFARPLAGQPDSAFLAEGSAVTVYEGCRI